MKKAILIFFLMSSAVTFAQDILMQNGTATQCSGVLYDSGGEFANYSSGESLVFTICPENPGELSQLDFTDFNIQAGADSMTIYNGDSTAAPAFGTFDGNTLPPSVRATSDNGSGCITVEFTSDASGTFSGWAATISCFLPCQTINSQIDTATPAPNGDGYIWVCPNEDVTLTGSGVFSLDGTGATYEWDLGDGNTITGQTATFSYATPGVYIVNLNIRDTNTGTDPLGCTNNNLINQVIQVATEPDFTGTQAANPTLCFGDTTTIDGVVNPVEFLNDCTPPVSGITFLPDGSGAVYETSITVDCYDSSQTLDNIGQLVNICINMEHSYLGDLDIEIISPNGQVVRIHDQQGSGSANLGEPWATGTVDGQSNNTTPGVGYDYCFEPNTGNPTLVGGIQNGGTFTNGDGPGTYTDSFVPAGTYSSLNPLSGLLGSPLNGNWTIRIVDNISADNGHVFSWGIEFDPALQPPELSFTPTITSEAWDTDATITNTTGNTITVAPPTAGTHTYTYRVTDDFGCEYTYDVDVEVLPEIINDTPSDLFLCNPGAPPYIFDLTENTPIILTPSPNAGDLNVTYHETQADADGDVNPIPNPDNYTGTDGQIIYVRVEYLTSGCYESETFTLNITSQPTINPVGDMVVCDDSSNDGTEPFNLESQSATILGAQSDTTFIVTYHTSFNDADMNVGALTSPYNNVGSPQPIFVRVQVIGDSACNNVSVTPLFNLIVNPANDASFTMTATCDGGTATITGDVGGTFAFNPIPTDTAVINSTTGTVTGATSGASYTIEYTVPGTCPATSTQTLTVLPEDDSSFTLTPTCDGATANITGVIGGTFVFNPIPLDTAVINPLTGTITGATPSATYTVEYTTVGICPSTTTQNVTVLPAEDASFTMTSTCDGGLATITGDTGGVFTLNPDPGLPVTIDASTGTIIGGTSGVTYTVVYTTLGSCSENSTQNVTVSAADDASFTVTPTCDGATVNITGTLGGTFALNPVPTDAAINPITGTVTGGTSGASYTIEYTTPGVCSEVSTETFNVFLADDASFTIAPTCDGGISTVTGLSGGTFAFNPLPGDTAAVNPLTGVITGGTSDAVYTLEYTTNGACPSTSMQSVTVHPAVIAIPPTALEVCDDGVPDGLTSIDLTLKNLEITGNNPDYSVSYYLT
ncbi:PKD domain-containing protein, partial [Ichthyenterobacterium magnum]